MCYLWIDNIFFLDWNVLEGICFYIPCEDIKFKLYQNSRRGQIEFNDVQLAVSASAEVII